MDKIIITAADVTGPESLSTLPPTTEPAIPLLWRNLSLLLILCLPLLIIVTIVGLVTVRHRPLSVRHAYAIHYCCLLLASGILWTIAVFALIIRIPNNSLDQATGATVLSLGTFPLLPSKNALTARDIARELSPLVVVVHHAESSSFRQVGGTKQTYGAGVIALATHKGCLVLTSRHVIDALSRRLSIGILVGVTLQDGQEARATVVGLHRTLDLALLWVLREQSQTEYVQPLRSFKTVEIGEQIFVIGHPEGLQFSISGGLVAQTRGADLIQMSAPVSPGNSGGPVYDTHGRLIAIVQSVFDKAKSPNAENLNFAVRADDLLKVDVWTLSKEGSLAIASLAAIVNHGQGELNLIDTTK